MLRFVSVYKGRDVTDLMNQIRKVGQRLIAAQPREMAVGNIVRRVLALVREVAQVGSDADTNAAMSESGGPPHSPTHTPVKPFLHHSISTFSPLKHGGIQPGDASLLQVDGSSDTEQSLRPPLLSSHTSHSPGAPLVQSLFSIFSTPEARSPSSTPTGHITPVGRASLSMSNLASLGDFAKDIKAEVCEGIREMLDELDQVDEQIAAYALDQIHANEIILTHTSSTTVQKFLLTAAKKRKFTVIHAESFPNDHEDTRAVVLHGQKPNNDEEPEGDDRFKSLTAAGITVILIPDSAVFALMSRVNKVILATHSVLANGALVAAAGARNIAMAAKMHKTPVVVLSGVYKLSPIYPFDVEELIEYGDAGKAAAFDDGEFVEAVEVVNPVFDYVPADLVDLYITNL